MIKKILAGSLMISSATFSLHAVALQVTGTKEVKTLSHQARPGMLAAQEIPVTLMQVKLSTQEIAALQKQQQLPKRKSLLASDLPVPSKVELNLNKFPVLNQGRHGTCVTFATVAAFNYLLDKVDHVSPMCSLELGSTLEMNGYYPSGWEGSFGPMVLDQFMRFGYIKTANCRDVYPLNNEYDTGTPKSIENYKKSSNSLLWEQMNSKTASRVYWAPIVSMDERFNVDGNETYDGQKALLQVKQTLANNKDNVKGIVTIGFLLYGNECHAGACAKHSTSDDTWVMTSNIRYMLEKSKYDRNLAPDAGHEVTIIGYDDDAVSIDREGKTHKGLLTIRNSWGSQAGDKGNYYMSYDYFIALVDEVQKINKVVISLSN